MGLEVCMAMWQLEVYIAARGVYRYELLEIVVARPCLANGFIKSLGVARPFRSWTIYSSSIENYSDFSLLDTRIEDAG